MGFRFGVRGEMATSDASLWQSSMQLSRPIPSSVYGVGVRVQGVEAGACPPSSSECATFYVQGQNSASCLGANLSTPLICTRPARERSALKVEHKTAALCLMHQTWPSLASNATRERALPGFRQSFKNDRQLLGRPLPASTWLVSPSAPTNLCNQPTL